MTYEDAKSREERVAFAVTEYRRLHPKNSSPDVRDYAPFLKSFLDVEIKHAIIEWLGDFKVGLNRLTDDEVHRMLREMAEQVITLRRECHDKLKGT